MFTFHYHFFHSFRAYSQIHGLALMQLVPRLPVPFTFGCNLLAIYTTVPPRSWH